VKNKKTFIGLNLSVFMMMLGVGMIMALLPKRIIVLTGSGATVGYLASAFAISYIILQVPLGNLSDRYGFKFFLFLGYLVCFITGVMYYFSNHANLYFLGRVFQGIGEAPIWALAPALLSIKYPGSKGKVIGIYNASIHIGLTIGPLLGILLSNYLIGNKPFLFYAGVCLIGALILWFSVEKVNHDEFKEKQTINFRNIIELVTTRNSLAALFGITLYGAGYGIFLTTIPSFLIINKNFNQTFVGIFFSLFYIAISISQIITGALSDKMGRKIFMIAGLLTASFGIAIFSELNQPLISVVLTIVSLGLGVFYLSSMAFLNEVVSNSLKGTISGAYYLFWGIGFFFGPIIIGQIAKSGSSLGYQLFSAFLLIEALILVFCSKEKANKEGQILS
jgi:MFS family permease